MGRLYLMVYVLQMRDASVELDGLSGFMCPQGVQDHIFAVKEQCCQLNPTTNGSVSYLRKNIRSSEPQEEEQ